MGRRQQDPSDGDRAGPANGVGHVAGKEHGDQRRNGGDPEHGADVGFIGAEALDVNYIGVASVDEFVRRAERLGAKVVVPKMPVPTMGWFAQLQDTEGNIFAVWQTDAAAA